MSVPKSSSDRGEASEPLVYQWPDDRNVEVWKSEPQVTSSVPPALAGVSKLGPKTLLHPPAHSGP